MKYFNEHRLVRSAICVEEYNKLHSKIFFFFIGIFLCLMWSWDYANEYKKAEKEIGKVKAKMKANVNWLYHL